MHLLSGATHLVDGRVRAQVAGTGLSVLRGLVAVAVVAPLFVLGQITPASSASFQQLQAQITQLNTQIEIASQAYNGTLDKMDSLNVTAKAATQRATAASVKIGSARAQLAIIASALYRGGDLATLQLFLGNDPQSMLAQNGLATSLADREAQAGGR